jgi:predicted metallopeptidase
MGIRYEIADDIQREVNEIAETLFPHVKLDSVVCLRSHGSSSRGTIARCHALGKAMQLALGRRGFYVIEVISRRFDKMSPDDKTKTLIHELMHIPKSFGGGFIHHDIVHARNVERMYQHYCNLKGKNTKDPRHKDLYHFEEESNLTPGQKIEREFFVVLEKKDTNFQKKKSWWF